MNPRLQFVFLNAGHFIDHLLPLVFASAAALVLTREWGMSSVSYTHLTLPTIYSV